MKKIGLIVNPYAGIGGKAGLKGSDGEETVKLALELGAEPESSRKAAMALCKLKEVVPGVLVHTLPGPLGEVSCREAGIAYKLYGHDNAGGTTAADTVKGVRTLQAAGIEVLLFAGGDGTARDLSGILDNKVMPVGIPAGCKMYSGVYALTPAHAGILAGKCCLGMVDSMKDAEIMDIDEELFRQGVAEIRLYDYMKVPDDSSLLQNCKGAAAGSDAFARRGAAAYAVSLMQEDVLYIIGTGSTMEAVTEELGLSGTLLGVDLVYNRRIVGRDCSEKDILSVLRQYSRAEIFTSVIGKQGYVFGRGNQQISSEIIRRTGTENIRIIATENKLAGLKKLYADTGDPEINKKLCGWHRVIAGYRYEIMMKLES